MEKNRAWTPKEIVEKYDCATWDDIRDRPTFYWKDDVEYLIKEKIKLIIIDVDKMLMQNVIYAKDWDKIANKYLGDGGD